MNTNAKLVLLDAHALIHRAYHALPPLTSKKGELVNAVYGFALVLLKIIKDLKPDYLAAAFDRPEPTFRHKVFKEYKSQRPKAEPGLISQFLLVRELVRVFNIPIYEKAGFEADDIIATVVAKTKNQSAGGRTKIVIVTGDLDALQLVDDNTEVLGLKRGVSDTVTYDIKAVEERFGLKPQELIDFKALKGDVSDNIPGLPGIGDKTASLLLQKYGNLENIYKNIPPEADRWIKLKIRETLIQNKELAFSNRNLVILRNDLDINFDLEQARFGNVNQETITTFFKELGFYSLINRISGDQKETVATTLFEFNKETIDESLKIAAYLLNPGERDYSFEKLKTQYSVESQEELKEVIESKLKEENLWEVYQKIELPLIPVLREMEKNGVKINDIKLKALQKECEKAIKERGSEIYKFAGVVFNINSPTQLSNILFERLKIPIKGLRKTPKGVISTKASELEKLANQNPIINLIMEYRELAKLNTTYLTALPEFINKKTKRIHTTFIQTGTATGRLASENPNLQNIPARGEWGKTREIFIAEEGSKLVSFDYSQLELRLAAHLSNDPKMISAFKQGLDIHSLTATEVNNIPISDVTKELREQAKTLNFGVLYGMGPQGFSEAAHVPRDKAVKFITEYFNDFKKLAEWILEIREKTRDEGFIATLTGRRRYLPEIYSSHFQVRAAAERMAVNMPIQGLAADIIKIAMINIYKENFPAKLLLQIHDELLFEIKETNTSDTIWKIKKIMESAFKLSVPLKVKISVGPSWGELKELDI